MGILRTARQGKHTLIAWVSFPCHSGAGMVRSVGETIAAPDGTRLGCRLIFFSWFGCSSMRRQMFLGGKGRKIRTCGAALTST